MCVLQKEEKERQHEDELSAVEPDDLEQRECILLLLCILCAITCTGILSTQFTAAPQQEDGSADGSKPKFECVYCDYMSGWTRKDLQRHVLEKHAHLKLVSNVDVPLHAAEFCVILRNPAP